MIITKKNPSPLMSYFLLFRSGLPASPSSKAKLIKKKIKRRKISQSFITCSQPIHDKFEGVYFFFCFNIPNLEKRGGSWFSTICIYSRVPQDSFLTHKDTTSLTYSTLGHLIGCFWYGEIGLFSLPIFCNN